MSEPATHPAATSFPAPVLSLPLGLEVLRTVSGALVCLEIVCFLDPSFESFFLCCVQVSMTFRPARDSPQQPCVRGSGLDPGGLVPGAGAVDPGMGDVRVRHQLLPLVRLPHLPRDRPVRPSPHGLELPGCVLPFPGAALLLRRLRAGGRGHGGERRRRRDAPDQQHRHAHVRPIPPGQHPGPHVGESVQY